MIFEFARKTSTILKNKTKLLHSYLFNMTLVSSDNNLDIMTQNFVKKTLIYIYIYTFITKL